MLDLCASDIRAKKQSGRMTGWKPLLKTALTTSALVALTESSHSCGNW